MCSRQLAENTGRKNDAKNHHLGTVAQLCQATSSQLRTYRQSEKKLVKQQYLLHMCSQYGELWPTGGWDHFVSLGHPSKFQRVSRLGSVTAATSLNGSQPNFARCLAVSCAATLHIFGGCCPVTEFCQVQYSVCVLQVLRSPIGSITARHSSSGCEPNFAAPSTGHHLYSAGWPSRWALAHC